MSIFCASVEKNSFWTERNVRVSYARNVGRAASYSSNLLMRRSVMVVSVVWHS